MSKAFRKIMSGLEEAKAFAQGEPASDFGVHRRRIIRNEIAAVRLKASLTQPEFARLLGASIGTVRKWESGERSPSGAASRLLRLLDARPEIVTEVLGVRPKSPKRSPRSRLAAAE